MARIKLYQRNPAQQYVGVPPMDNSGQIIANAVASSANTLSSQANQNYQQNQYMARNMLNQATGDIGQALSQTMRDKAAAQKALAVNQEKMQAVQDHADISNEAVPLNYRLNQVDAAAQKLPADQQLDYFTKTAPEVLKKHIEDSGVNPTVAQGLMDKGNSWIISNQTSIQDRVPKIKEAELKSAGVANEQLIEQNAANVPWEMTNKQIQEQGIAALAYKTPGQNKIDTFNLKARSLLARVQADGIEDPVGTLSRLTAQEHPGTPAPQEMQAQTQALPAQSQVAPIPASTPAGHLSKATKSGLVPPPPPGRMELPMISDAYRQQLGLLPGPNQQQQPQPPQQQAQMQTVPTGKYLEKFIDPDTGIPLINNDQRSKLITEISQRVHNVAVANKSAQVEATQAATRRGQLQLMGIARAANTPEIDPNYLPGLNVAHAQAQQMLDAELSKPEDQQNLELAHSIQSGRDYLSNKIDEKNADIKREANERQQALDRIQQQIKEEKLTVKEGDQEFRQFLADQKQRAKDVWDGKVKDSKVVYENGQNSRIEVKTAFDRMQIALAQKMPLTQDMVDTARIKLEQAHKDGHLNILGQKDDYYESHRAYLTALQKASDENKPAPAWHEAVGGAITGAYNNVVNAFSGQKVGDKTVQPIDVHVQKQNQYAGKEADYRKRKGIPDDQPLDPDPIKASLIRTNLDAFANAAVLRHGVK